MPLRLGSLFSGIGGLELGLERAGLGRTVYQVERDAYARHVLARHWPDVPRFDDVRTVGAHNLPRVDVICGGFPCQDVSAAGKQAGIGTPEAPTSRSGLWFEMRRIIDEQRPAWVVVENVAHTWRRYVPLVRRELWELGYASLPLRVRACDVGARHERARILLVAGDPADVDGIALRLVAERAAAGRVDLRGGWEAEPGEDAADAGSLGRGAPAERARGGLGGAGRRPADRGGAPGRADATDADGIGGRAGAAGRAAPHDEVRAPEGGDAADDAGERLALGEHVGGDAGEQRAPAAGGADGCVAPGFGLAPRPWMVRGLHGIPGGVDGPWKRAGWTGARLREARIRGLGNAVVPAVAEAVGRLIVDAIRTRSLLVAPDVAAVAK
jgi:site-specific DNA-cytosine methylase